MIKKATHFAGMLALLAIALSLLLPSIKAAMGAIITIAVVLGAAAIAAMIAYKFFLK